MSLHASGTKWILIWSALLLLAAPGQAFSAVPPTDASPASASTAAQRDDVRTDRLLASRGGVQDRQRYRRTNNHIQRQPLRTQRRGKTSSNPSTLRDWQNTEKTRTDNRPESFGSDFNRNSPEYKRQPRHQGYQYFTPSSKESAWDTK